MKVVTIEKDIVSVLDELIEALTETPPEFKATNTTEFKIIPIQNHAIGRDEMIKLLTRRNEFLHKTMAISVVNGEHYDRRFEKE